MTSSLEIQTQSDFLTFIKDEAMPNGNLSIRGVARCCDVPHTSLIRGGALKSNKLSETLSSKGFHAGALTENGFPPQAVWLCIEYFAYESQAEAPMAKQLARTFGAIGVMSTLSQLAGIPAMPEPQPIVNPLDAQIQRAIALAGGGGALAIETFKMLNGLTAPTIPTIPSPIQDLEDLTTHQKKVQDDRIIFDEFLSKLRIALDEGMLDGSMKADVTTRQGKYIAIHLLSVLDALESRLDYRPQATDLQRAIAKYGGKCGQNQRFEPESPTKRNGHRSIVRKCIVIPTSLF